jgi:hypothetical protein
MDMTVNKDIKGEIFDSLLKVAAKDAMHRELNDMPTLEELNELYPPSEELNKRVYAAINKETRKKKTKQAFRWIGKVAAIFCAVLVVSVGALMSVEASRNFILNLFIDVRDDHIVFDFGGQVYDLPNETVRMGFGYIPYGFSIVAYHRLEALDVTILTNEYGHEIIIAHHFSTTPLIAVDNELRDFSIISVNGIETFLFESIYEYARNQAMWAYTDGVISISTTLDLDELLKIVESFTQ